MIKILFLLFICHGSILKGSEKACKINGLRQEEAFTTPLLRHFWIEL